MNDFDEEVLTVVMLRVQAWEKVNDTNYSGQLGQVEFEELLLKAGYSPRVAHEAALKRGWDRLDAGVTI